MLAEKGIVHKEDPGTDPDLEKKRTLCKNSKEVTYFKYDNSFFKILAHK